MMGDFDWTVMGATGRVVAGIWFWIFMILIVLLMLNMLLAIVMDAYSEVKQQAGNAETLFTEIKQTYVRWKGIRRKQLVPLSHVLKALDTDQKKAKQAMADAAEAAEGEEG